MGGAMTDGTTIIACKYNGGILLAADGRSSNVSALSNLSLIIVHFLFFRVCMLEINARISLSQSIKEFIARDLELLLTLVTSPESLDITLTFKQLNSETSQQLKAQPVS